MTRRMLVCGGRDFESAETVNRWLDSISKAHGVTILVHGGARGADTLAGGWARTKGMTTEVHMADWMKHGRGAGPRRNLTMLATLQPGDLVVAFDGGRGTKHMVEAASKRTDIRTIIITGTMNYP